MLEFSKSKFSFIDLLSVSQLIWKDSAKPMHSGVERLFCQTNKISLLKYPFLTVLSKIYRLTKVDVIGTREVSIFFFSFIPWYLKMTPYVPKTAANCLKSLNK